MKTVDASKARKIYSIDGHGFARFYVTHARALTHKQVQVLLLEHLAPYRKEAAAIERAFKRKHGIKPKELELRVERSRRESQRYEKWYEGSRYQQLDRGVVAVIEQALDAAGFSRVTFSDIWVRGEAGGDTDLLRSGVERVAVFLEEATQPPTKITKRKAPKPRGSRK